MLSWCSINHNLINIVAKRYSSRDFVRATAIVTERCGAVERRWTTCVYVHVCLCNTCMFVHTARFASKIHNNLKCLLPDMCLCMLIKTRFVRCVRSAHFIWAASLHEESHLLSYYRFDMSSVVSSRRYCTLSAQAELDRRAMDARTIITYLSNNNKKR